MSALPIPSVESKAHSQKICELIKQRIVESGGWISFAEFMHMALYTPALGYYSGGAQKFGQGGDFVTAPEISPLFAQTIARQALQILSSGCDDILELGAGTGILAADLLSELSQLKQLPKQYFILEVSDYLRQIQRKTLQKKLSQDLYQRIVWLEKLPEDFTGLILANELLDALPAQLVYKNNDALYERGVTSDGEFIWQDKSLQMGVLYKSVIDYELPNDYLTEVCLAVTGLIHSLADSLKQGAILLIDYGFSAREYYHPQRNQGTLMCHYQHYGHSNPLINIGLQDITAHINFTQIKQAGEAYGISLAGYVSQAQFLINCGILELLAKISPNDMATYAPLAAAAQKLLSPAEMGELFKVIGFTKNLNMPLLGFSSGDKSHTL